MKLNEDANRSINLVRSYSAGEIAVSGQTLERPCIVAATTLISDWARDFASLDLADLDALWTLQPEVVLLGTGAKLRFPPAKIREAFARRRIALETMDLGAACRTYNVLVQEDRAVVAALFTDRSMLPHQE